MIPIIEEERTEAPERVNNFRVSLLNWIVPEFHKHSFREGTNAQTERPL